VVSTQSTTRYGNRFFFFFFFFCHKKNKRSGAPSYGPQNDNNSLDPLKMHCDKRFAYLRAIRARTLTDVLPE
jgi:hypothetical protein